MSSISSVVFAWVQKYHRYDAQTTGYAIPSQKFVRLARASVVVLHRPLEIWRSCNNVVILVSRVTSDLILHEDQSNRPVFLVRELIGNPDVRLCFAVIRRTNGNGNATEIQAISAILINAKCKCEVSLIMRWLRSTTLHVICERKKSATIKRKDKHANELVILLWRYFKLYRARGARDKSIL